MTSTEPIDLDGAHLDGGQHACVGAVTLQRVGERQCVHHRRQHAHVVGGSAVHALCAGREPTKDVAAANHDSRLDADPPHFDDLCRDLVGDQGVDTIVTTSHQGFA